MDDTAEITALMEQTRNLIERAVDIWLTGGWAMLAIATVAMVLFAMGVHIYLRLRAKGFERISEKTWRQWIDQPGKREGPIGEMLAFVTGSRSLEENVTFFEELRTAEIKPFERDLRVMKICVSATPLLGLLGTVTGMLATFGALAEGSGGEKTMGLVAAGISEALITTETGLVIALPGLFFHYQLTRKHHRYAAFLAHLETVCAQSLHRKIRDTAPQPTTDVAEAHAEA
ncbi:MAG: MotA/TolQ/ExbB proton channel family protein [Phycisphaeraceae bacterium]